MLKDDIFVTQLLPYESNITHFSSHKSSFVIRVYFLKHLFLLTVYMYFKLNFLFTTKYFTQYLSF